jgi:hypothetical protein
VVLNDWNSGKIKYFTVPPERITSSARAALVQDWGKEFSMGEEANIEGNEVDMVTDTQS